MQLSKNFYLSELTASPTAKALKISNIPDQYAIANLKLVTQKILQPVRDRYGVSFSPNSGYRCQELNRRVGGSRNSQHTEGKAVDFEVPGVSNYDLALWCSRNLEFDQLILEFYTLGDPHSGWVHCSFNQGKNRKQVMTACKANGKTIYRAGLLK